MPMMILLASVAAAAQPAPDTVPPPLPPPIVVTGRRPRDNERALAACLERRCPTDEDVDASLARAEELFIAGDYDEAQAITKAALKRNRDRAALHPIPVSDLQRANARIAAHRGSKFDFRNSTYGIRNALESGLPGDDPRLVGADLEIAAMLMSIGSADGARGAYAKASERALTIGRSDLSAMARLRSAWIDHAAGNRRDARRRIGEIANATDPKQRIPSLAARILLARIDRANGKLESSDALIRELAAFRAVKPVLIYAPPIDPAEAAAVRGSRKQERLADEDTGDQWLDIGFWIRSDGRTEEAEILRRSGRTSWAEPVLASIFARRYAATSGIGDLGGFRVERYTLTNFATFRSGSRIKIPGPARIEMLDLTLDGTATAVANRKTAD